METTVTKRTCSETPSIDSATDDKMRKLLQRVFPESAWISGLPTVREFFAAILDRFGERLSEGREKFGMPKLDHHTVQRELLFLENLDVPIMTIQGRTVTFRFLYTESYRIIGTTTAPETGLAAKTLASFRHRVAQYIHVIRNARKDDD